ncbi:MAG: hypothetical protein BWK77_04000 [Verrucomicrobia bacterium A1]|nr:MAG: hypothetical protein BWK77_04000 [Verrucomicrobia bacterium A1]
MERSVVRGELDNRQKGRVTGRVWLLGREQPVELLLDGNCLSDLAGCRFTFVNPHPEPGDAVDLMTFQQGPVGDITAARKVRDVPMEEVERVLRAGEKLNSERYPLVHVLRIEWFSTTNGCVIIESPRYRLEIGEREWTPDPAEEKRRPSVEEEIEREFGEEDFEYDPESDRRMDEFGWEKFMRESDQRSDQFGKLLEKYMDHPDRDRIVAREMGWSWMEEALDAEERGENAAVEETPFDEVPELVPNPLTEGTDWVRDDHGGIEHPLVLRAHRVGLDMWRHAEAIGQHGDAGDPDLGEMVFQTQTTAAKLAGALNHLAYEDDPDPGFVVAALKRALNYLHCALAAADRLAVKAVLDAQRLKEYQAGLFGVREDVLALMKRFREKL